LLVSELESVLLSTLESLLASLGDESCRSTVETVECAAAL
jgi:hypothetical protein